MSLSCVSSLFDADYSSQLLTWPVLSLTQLLNEWSLPGLRGSLESMRGSECREPGVRTHANGGSGGAPTPVVSEITRR